MSGKKKYLDFCQQSGITPLPVTEHSLIHFVAFVVNQGLKHQTIKSYITAVRHLQVVGGGGDPKIGDMAQLALALRGTRKEQLGLPKRPRLPITPSVLLRMRSVWDCQATDWDHIMLWAACCLGFFGFLRSGEFTVPDDGSFDPAQHLSFSDIAADNPANPRMLSIRIKQSKTDPFRMGVSIFVSRTDTSRLCPVAALLSYLALRGPGEGPLFRFKDGRALTRTRLIDAVRKTLAKAGLNPEAYSGHSFRIGAATTAAACGVPVDTIKTLGRWKSQAYQLYVRLPRDQLASISRTLASSKV